MIRDQIIEDTKTAGTPPDLSNVAARMNIGVDALLAQIREEPPVERLAGLSSAQAHLLMNHYKDFEMFAEGVKTVLTSFAETREKIRDIEKKSKK